ncbi:hypothetical protein ACFU7D_20035 [Nocardioides sp. NPDC057577]
MILACHTLVYSDDHGGLVAMVRVPGADDVQIYQPRHRTAYDS